MSSSVKIPATMKQIMVKTLINDIRKATEIVEVPVPKPGPNEVLVRIIYAGVNASDILYCNGSYRPDDPLPYPAGLECLGEVASTGDGSKYKVGQYVVACTYGCFSEYVVAHDARIIPVPSADPTFMSLGLSGTTASLALEKKANLKAGETVLVTGAAGGTGQFAVQLAKLAGCQVIGTCSTQEKADFLKSIGCDRPINYTTEDLDQVLTKEYPNGVNVVYECIGKEIFDTALKHLAIHGRLIVIGAISVYEGPGSTLQKNASSYAVSLVALGKSADVRGFHLKHHLAELGAHVEKLSRHYVTGQIKAATDNGEKAANGPFYGIEKIYEAIDYMFAKKNIGKIVVQLSDKS